MCNNIINKYKQAREDRLRFKYIIKCGAALQSPTNTIYPLVLRGREYIL